MYSVLLRPVDGARPVPDQVALHKSWLEAGMAEGIFMLWGSLDSGGGAILARAESRTVLEERIAADPFVQGSIVSAEILQLTPARVEPQLAQFFD